MSRSGELLRNGFPKLAFGIRTLDLRQFGGHFFISKYKALCNTNFIGMIIFIVILGVRI
jgi:hypothetical protein